jgi:hypothetical protein
MVVEEEKEGEEEKYFMYLKTKDIVKGKIKPEDLKDLYIFVEEDTHDHQIALAVNILAEKGGYRVVTSYVRMPDVEVVIMKK